MVPVNELKISKVWLDEMETECDRCGFCGYLCPEVFEVPDKMVVKKDVDLERFKGEIIEAANSCPTQVIAVEFDKSGKRDYPLRA